VNTEGVEVRRLTGVRPRCEAWSVRGRARCPNRARWGALYHDELAFSACGHHRRWAEHFSPLAERLKTALEPLVTVRRARV
jgi:hypothetical protein